MICLDFKSSKLDWLVFILVQKASPAKIKKGF